jgi:hypothetical protein
MADTLHQMKLFKYILFMLLLYTGSMATVHADTSASEPSHSVILPIASRSHADLTQSIDTAFYTILMRLTDAPSIDAVLKQQHSQLNAQQYIQYYRYFSPNTPGTPSALHIQIFFNVKAIKSAIEAQDAEIRKASTAEHLVSLHISHIDDLQEYTKVLQYIQQLTGVKQASLEHVSLDQITLTLTLVNITLEQFIEYLNQNAWLEFIKEDHASRQTQKEYTQNIIPILYYSYDQATTP